MCFQSRLQGYSRERQWGDAKVNVPILHHLDKMVHCLTFTSLYQPRVWGGQKLNAIFGRSIPPKTPIGESWELVDRAEEQSVVDTGPYQGWSLHRLWTERRAELFGDWFDDERFPILIKILDAAEPLSVQVHPPLTVAKELKGEPKTEIWYFVETTPEAGIYVGLKQGTTKEQFRAALTDGSVADYVHRISTRPDTFIFIPSGRIHAIDAGNLIFEIQQNSDTTYRVFDWNRVGLDGKPRELHIEPCLASIDFSDFEPSLDTTDDEVIASCHHFHVECWRLDKPRVAHRQNHFAVFQCVSGRLEFAGRIFGPGDLFLATVEGHAEMLIPRKLNTKILRTTIEKK
jgi:mannose-6-phosphate isomerase